MRNTLLLAAASTLLLGCGGAARSGPDGRAERLTGSIAPMQQRSGSALGSSQARYFGTVSLEPGRENYSRVRIMVNSPTQNISLRWAIHPGTCGAASLPLMAFDQFPFIEVGSNGRGELTAELPLSFPQSAVHVNLYVNASADMANVVACANLR